MEAYNEMREINVEMSSFEKEQYINFYCFDDYYYGHENNLKLPENFSQKIIELENKLNRLEYFDVSTVEELAYLYKVKDKLYYREVLNTSLGEFLLIGNYFSSRSYNVY